MNLGPAFPKTPLKWMISFNSLIVVLILIHDFYLCCSSLGLLYLKQRVEEGGTQMGIGWISPSCRRCSRRTEFLVELLLGRLEAWDRWQSATASIRASAHGKSLVRKLTSFSLEVLHLLSIDLDVTLQLHSLRLL